MRNVSGEREEIFTMPDEIYFVGYVDGVFYFQDRGKYIDNECICDTTLFAFTVGENDLLPLVVIPGLSDGDTMYNDAKIENFESCGDWLVMSAGHYYGTGNFFHGEILVVKKDGSELHSLPDSYGTNYWFIMDGWIYYNSDWNPDIGYENYAGLFRIQPADEKPQIIGDHKRIISCMNGNIYYYSKAY